jgi:molybdopterin molybdotransferase
MLSVAEALYHVLHNATPKAAATVPLAESLGLTLAEDIVSDIDSPPHDKSLVDGYAVRVADFTNGNATLAVLEEITAGLVPTKTVTAGSCTRIMTGAPIPSGTDAIVMVEQTVSVGDASSPLAPCGRGAGGEGYSETVDPTLPHVTLRDPTIRPSQNILPRGKSMRAGDIVLARGTTLEPAAIGLLAEIGRTAISVIPKATVAILSTGNELVPADQRPGPGQIRNSNSPLLAACVTRAGAVPIKLGIARDTRDDLRRAITQGLEYDILLISGGVSAGVLDLVPSVLAELGVEQVFHKVNLKPGKPLWFGRAGNASQATAAKSNSLLAPRSSLPSADSALRTSHSALVFGLPGNPISSLVCFDLFVKPALARLAGRQAATHETRPATLASDFTQRGDRPTYFPGVLQSTADGLQVTPNNWKGSADLRGFTGANCLIIFPAGERKYQIGDTVELLPT